MQTRFGKREICYTCYRPKSSCMCKYITKIETKTKFVFLMHPKEHRKIKNGTGRLTHLSLPNSELYVDIDFTNHTKVNALLKTHECYVLYPSSKAHNLNQQPLHVKTPDKPKAIFLIDSTWACSIKMMRESKNLHHLPHISFDNTKSSEFKIKKQPQTYCLSTIESTLYVLELLHSWEHEQLEEKNLENFLAPFHAMNNYQIACANSRSSSKRQ